MRRVVPAQGLTPLLTVAMLLSTPGLASGAPATPDTLAALIADVADANQKLQNLGAAVQTQQESVNKAIEEVHTARENAESSKKDVDVSQKSVADANEAITEAQRKFDRFAAAAYVNGPSGSYLTASSPEEFIATATAGQTLAASTAQVMTNVQRARTEQVNRESIARLAKKKADQATADAEASMDNAVSSLNSAQHTFADQQGEIHQLAAQRDQAKAKLEAARQVAAPPAAVVAAPAPAATPGSPAPAGAPSPGPDNQGSADWDHASDKSGVKVPYGDASQWDMTLPMIPSAFVSGDPIQIINAVLVIMQTSGQVTSDLGRKFLQTLGILPTPTGLTNDGGIPQAYGSRAVEAVIARGMSQRGVPYSWGGGTASGASRGIDSGAGTVGFDCSGLVLYAFAGVGIKLPHYSGSQYNMGRKIPTSQMRRGDVIFYGPNGSQHVTIYLGNDQMLEAPHTGSVVKVSPVRTSGMTPFVVRYVEY